MGKTGYFKNSGFLLFIILTAIRLLLVIQNGIRESLSDNRDNYFISNLCVYYFVFVICTTTNLNRIKQLFQMDRYHNKYRIASARLKNWDYGSNAMYIVTICTEHRVKNI